MKIFDHLDKLNIFLTVAERGSISHAAKELALTQPAITRAIQTFESATGYPLFTRDRNGMHLTEGGRILFETGSRVLRDVADAVKQGANIRNKMAGHFAIGTYESLAEYLWPSFLLKAQKEFPQISLTLKTNSKGGHLEELKRGALDLLVDAEPRDHGGLTLWPLFSDHFAFYSKQKLELNPQTATETSLLFVRNVIDENNITLEQHLGDAGYHFQRDYSFDSFTTVMRMCENGLGVAILPQKLAKKQSSLRQLKAQGFKESFGLHRIFATVSPFRENDRRIKSLISLLRSELSS